MKLAPFKLALSHYLSPGAGWQHFTKSLYFIALYSSSTFPPFGNQMLCDLLWSLATQYVYHHTSQMKRVLITSSSSVKVGLPRMVHSVPESKMMLWQNLSLSPKVGWDLIDAESDK
eukprot:14277544-Ditylum_brightwellii.AAC.1